MRGAVASTGGVRHGRRVVLPRDVSGCVAWLRADIGVTLDGSSLVQSVADMSGAGNAASEATAGKRLAIDSTAFGGRPAFVSDGTKALKIPSLTLTTFTIIIVQKLSGVAGLIYEHSVDAQANPGCWLYSTNDAPTIQVLRGATASSKIATAGWGVDDAAKVVTQVYGGTHATHKLYVNGADTGATSSAANDPGAASVTADFYLFGRNEATAFPATGRIAEVAIYNRALSDAERLRIERYMGGRCRIAVA